MLVALPGGKGLCKLESIHGNQGEISIFHSIARSETVRLPLSLLTRAYLSPQTRVYVVQDDRFKVGRIVDYLGRDDKGLIEYAVRFPNGNRCDLFEPHLFLRLWSTPDDPAEVIAHGGAESQYLHDRRQAALNPLLKLRSAAQGLTGLLSAGIDLAPHQVAAVRRVLSDPVQRYLLADEVGLGKTIEAGVIIRQHLIDNPNSVVLITVPQHLCNQWRRELKTKLRLDQFGDSFEVCSHLELASFARTPDVLVVDEAHHLVGTENGPLAIAAARLRSLSRKAPVLLLLSATPALGDENRFLALLNLLDPSAHQSDDLEGFRAKLARRRELGRLLLALDPEAPGLVLRQRGIEVQRLFPNDPFVSELAPRLIAATRDAPSSLPELCAELKAHIADTYRINQRLIRSRRVDAEGWEFTPRGPACQGELSFAHVKVETELRSWIQPLLTVLDEWRFAALQASREESTALDRAGARYAGILAAAGIGPAALINWIDTVGILETFADERHILSSLRRLASDSDGKDGVATMVESARRLIRNLRTNVPHPKVVVFCSSIESATDFHAALGAGIEGALLSLFAGSLEESNGDCLAAFTAPNTTAVLICDLEGEEGLNLASADAIVHLDLPFSAARIEQRIGRLDRFGRTHGIIRHRILLPCDEDESPWAGWLRFLSEGLLIFHRSISDVQFLLEEVEREVFRALLTGLDPQELDVLASNVRARIHQERLSQDEQYALDRIALAEDPIDSFLRSLEEAEEDEASLESGVDRWLVEALKLQKRPLPHFEHDVFRLAASRETLIPRQPWLESFGIDRDRSLTWKRRIATRHPETTLLRPGTPLIDFAERFTRWDDRGTAFITWRTVPEWARDIWMGFRLCFVIEANVRIEDLLAPSRSDLAATRRALRYFPLRSHIAHVDINGDEVTDPMLQDILRRPYRKGEQGGESGSDVNLSSRPHLLADLIDGTAFANVCRSVRSTVCDRLLADEAIAKLIESGVALAKADLQRRTNRFLRRDVLGDTIARAEIETIEMLIPAIRQPAVRLDAMGCFIVASTRPRQTVDA
ncbi:MAG: protein DpdE [Planctomycetota bacterium]|nr:protein DpdE [Planctomycetota bacterium]